MYMIMPNIRIKSLCVFLVLLDLLLELGELPTCLFTN
jgi:hypothetical protein